MSVRKIHDKQKRLFKVCFDDYGDIDAVYKYIAGEWVFQYSSAPIVKFFLTNTVAIRKGHLLPKGFTYAHPIVY